MTRTADVVIAGAGIAGIAAAWQIAARLGSTTTVLVDTPAAAVAHERPARRQLPGLVAAAGDGALADRSITMAEALLADGASFAMDRIGYLFVTADPEVARGLPGVVAERVAIGVDPGSVDVLDQCAARRAIPASRADAARGHPRQAGREASTRSGSVGRCWPSRWPPG